MKVQMISLSLFVLLSGCTHLHRIYEYEHILIGTETGNISIVVVPNWSKVSDSPEITQRGAPYNLVIRFNTTELAEEDISINLINYSPQSSSDRLFGFDSPGKTRAYKPTGSAGDYTAYYTAGIENLNIKHIPIYIRFRVIYQGREEIYQAEIQPIYREEKRNNTMDSIMSVEAPNQAPQPTPASLAAAGLGRYVLNRIF